jgi:hypothetical protein
VKKVLVNIVQAVEENVKARTKCEGDGGGAKTLCMPFEQDTLPVVQDPLPEGKLYLHLT